MTFNKKLFLQHIMKLKEHYYRQHQGQMAPLISKFTNQPKEFDNICARYAQELLDAIKFTDMSKAEENRIQKIAQCIHKTDLVLADELIKNTQPNLRPFIPDHIQKFVERYS